MSSWCEMRWNLGFFWNEVVDKVSVTLFPQIIAIPQIIAALKHPPPPQPQPLWPFSLSFIPSLLLFGYYSRKYGIVWNSWYFFQLHTHSKNIVFFSFPTAASKLLYFITLQCTSWLNHLLSSWHKYCTSTYCLKYNFF